MAGAEPGWKDYQYFRDRVETSENQARANLSEQAEILAESGVDFLIAEPTGRAGPRRADEVADQPRRDQEACEPEDELPQGRDLGIVHVALPCPHISCWTIPAPLWRFSTIR